MMNTRGQDLPIRKLILIVLAFFLVVFFYYFISGDGKDILYRFKTLLPDFNASVERADDVVSFRYRLVIGDVQYYDGVQWVDFKEKSRIKSGGRIIDSGLLIAGLRDYYYKGERDDILKEFRIDPGVTSSIDPGVTPIYSSKVPRLSASIYLHRQGVVAAFLVSTDKSASGTRGTYGLVHLDFRNYLTFRNFEKKDDSANGIAGDSAFYEAVAPGMRKWRDSVLKRPFSLSFPQDAAVVGPPEGLYMCVQYRYDDSEGYLVIDLSKPVAHTTRCEGA